MEISFVYPVSTLILINLQLLNGPHLQPLLVISWNKIYLKVLPLQNIIGDAKIELC